MQRSRTITRTRQRRSLTVERLENRSLLSGTPPIGLIPNHQVHFDVPQQESGPRFDFSQQQRALLIQTFLREQARLKSELNFSYPVIERSQINADVWIEPITARTSLVFTVQPKPEFSIIVIGLLNTDSDGRVDDSEPEQAPLTKPGLDGVDRLVTIPLAGLDSSLSTGSSNQPVDGGVKSNQVQEPKLSDGSARDLSSVISSESSEDMLEYVAALNALLAQSTSALLATPVSIDVMAQVIDGQFHDWLNLAAFRFRIDSAAAGNPGEPLTPDSIFINGRLAGQGSNVNGERYDAGLDYYGNGLSSCLFDYAEDHQALVDAALNEMIPVGASDSDSLSPILPLLGGMDDGQILLRFGGSESISDDRPDGDGWEVIASLTSQPALSSAGGILVVVTGLGVVSRHRRVEPLVRSARKGSA